MTQAQAARTSFTEYLQRRKGAEDAEHERYELARWTVWHSYNLSPFLKPGRKPRTPQDVVIFPWEEGAKKAKRITKKMAKVKDWEREALNAIAKDFFSRKYSS